MDRAIVYPGAIPVDTDLLRIGKYTKAGIGALADMVYGPGSIAASGLTCTPSSTDLSVMIGAGTITAPSVMDVNTFGGIGGGYEPDKTITTCQYQNESLVRVTIPSSGATYTLFGICSEQDVDPVVLPFFNAANPSQTQAGMNNNGEGLPIRRHAGITFVAATQAPPVPEGSIIVALYTLDIPSNATSLQGIQGQPGKVFWPTIPELATQTLLKAVSTPMQLVETGVSVSIPAWANRVELRVIGGGGGGASSSSISLKGSFSGAGGGAGGDAWGIYHVNTTDGGLLEVSVGYGGTTEQAGGTSLVTYNGQTLLQANGGQGGSFYAPSGSAGASGGTALGGNIWNQIGTFGGDGQAGDACFSGNGGDGPWGGGGRCGANGGRDATRFGSGGGGAYTTVTEGTQSKGGAGYGGCVMYRFLP
ncbi:glycine-rich domain-containing protein [Swingsia samuiensis]|uniref:Glycine-rich domain-containing protein n=1 Tax=Swingsia samuiensis TaxID=1293412 RepID=A0A4Y6UL61_9PROT|nr:hypothetical protein [Swingsia samuiensis]QDH16775.1 hypothetical protein E3D00_03730 [Swingsia samuiensis]